MVMMLHAHARKSCRSVAVQLWLKSHRGYSLSLRQHQAAYSYASMGNSQVRTTAHPDFSYEIANYDRGLLALT